MNHLTSQRNDAIDSTEDFRQKYIARCLFRKINREHQLCHDESGPFKLFCDDLRPGNFLVDDKHQLTGVVGWEFTYAAPTGLAYSPPFWLILELPELWGNYAARKSWVLNMVYWARIDRRFFGDGGY